MSHRKDLNNDLTATERTILVNLMLRYINDAVVNAHTGINHGNHEFFTGHRAYIAEMEFFLAISGGSQFVPLPKWNPANSIPPEFYVVKPQDNGITRPALINLTPNQPRPPQLSASAVCNHLTLQDLINNVNPWHGSVHIAVGGTMAQFQIASAAPIFWCWHAFVDEIYEAWQQCPSAWSDIKSVPGWFGAEDQGAGIAIADINGNGRPDLVVFHLDNPGGENHGYYRIGWDLDFNGHVSGGWSPIIPVPGWFGAENQGADIAIADINGNGRPDLVVFHLDNPGGDNHGYYRIGWDLDLNGHVSGGWSSIKSVPGWFGWENQGAGIAIADTHGHGDRDLVVFHVDNPGGDNHGYYRIGYHLNANGDVLHGWGNINQVPGWFGWENQGAGIGIGDINGDGRPDLVVFHVDNPGGENHGYYRIGWNL